MHCLHLKSTVSEINIATVLLQLILPWHIFFILSFYFQYYLFIYVAYRPHVAESCIIVQVIFDFDYGYLTHLYLT